MADILSDGPLAPESDSHCSVSTSRVLGQLKLAWPEHFVARACLSGCTGHSFSCNCVCGKPRTALNSLATSLASEPVDHLGRKLQYLDHRGGVLRDLVGEKNVNPVTQTLECNTKPVLGTDSDHLCVELETSQRLSWTVAKVICCTLIGALLV